MHRVLAEVIASNSSGASQDGLRRDASLNSISAGIAGGVGSIGATAANIYSTLQSSAGTLLSSESSQVAGQQNQGISNLLAKAGEIFKMPIPLKHASRENMYALNERIVAAESCWFAAKVMSLTK
jgi:hypothetical protein